MKVSNELKDLAVLDIDLGFSSIYQNSANMRMFHDDCNIFIETNHNKVVCISYDMVTVYDCSFDDMLKTFKNENIDNAYTEHDGESIDLA